MDGDLVRHGEPVYCYGHDDDFGPFFFKFGTYFPSTARACLNGHHFAQRQAAKAGVTFKALDNGLMGCDDPGALAALPVTDPRAHRGLRVEVAGHPPAPLHPQADLEAGYRYDISILQAEFSLTQVLDRPLAGRVLSTLTGQAFQRDALQG